MKSYTEQEFIELVASKQNINFLAAAITPWHALGIDATMLQLTEQGIALHGYIMVVAHNVTGTAIDESNFHMTAKTDIQVVCITPHAEHRSFRTKVVLKYNMYRYYISDFLGDNREILYWATPLKPSYELIPRIAKRINKNMMFILTDEGLGTYLRTTLSWWKYTFVESGIKAGMKATWTLLIRDSYFLSRLKKREQITHHQLLLQKQGKWVINKKATQFYKDIMAMEECPSDQLDYGKKILINTDMLYESGLLKDSSDVTAYQQVCNYAERYQIPVILKTHPREKKAAERYETLHCVVEQKNHVAQEVLLATADEMPLCVIGMASTTLVTAKVLFDIDAISLNYLLERSHFRNKECLEDFNRLFKDFLHMPKTEQELEDILNQIRSKKRNEIINNDK